MARKLKHYFSSQTITMVIDATMFSVYGKCDATVQVAKWENEVAILEINYQPRKAIKPQVLAKFHVD
jgi:hypothetical protein